MENKLNNSRIIWVDNVKIFAIILVALGHLFQGLFKAGIIENSIALNFFNNFIYMFHVRLFFICSGFLYQKTTVVNNLAQWKRNVAKKVIAFGIPYLSFSLVTFFIKILFADEVNSQAGGLFETIFINPEPPYWFLYTLIILFIITPTVKSKKSAGIMFTASVFIFAAVYYSLAYVNKTQLFITLVYATAIYIVWFSLGILLATVNISKLFSPFAIIPFIASGAFTYLMYRKVISSNQIFSFATSMLACLSVISFFGWLFRKNKQIGVLGFYSKYTMSVFLMHTIFAAGLRSVLLKLGITSITLHIAAGLAGSFMLPVAAQIIMQKIHLDIFIYPLKYIKLDRKNTK